MMKLWGLLLVVGMILIVTHSIELSETWKENNKILEKLDSLDEKTLTIHKFDIEKKP